VISGVLNATMQSISQNSLIDLLIENIMMKSPELLLPAGGLERMRAAFDFGADAVYAGQPRYSLRARNNEFVRFEKMKEAIDEAHSRGTQF
jgi:putative protease